MASENLSQLLARLKIFTREIFRAEDVSVLYFDALDTKLYTINPKLPDTLIQNLAHDNTKLENRSRSKTNKNGLFENLDYLNNLKKKSDRDSELDYLISHSSGDKSSKIYKILNYGEMYVNLDMNLKTEELSQDGNLQFRDAK